MWSYTDMATTATGSMQAYNTHIYTNNSSCYLQLTLYFVCFFFSCTLPFRCTVRRRLLAVYVCQELAQVKTPDNVKMIPTSPSELAWLLAGVVYPPNAADAPNIYIDDFRQAVEQKLTATSEPIVSNRLVATRFIQRLLEKVRLTGRACVAQVGKKSWFTMSVRRIMPRMTCGHDLVTMMSNALCTGCPSPMRVEVRQGWGMMRSFEVTG